MDKSSILIVFFIYIISIFYLYAEDMEHIIIRDGVAKTTIVLGKNPTEVEIHSAQELQKYVKQITGIILPISDKKSAANIFLGCPSTNIFIKQPCGNRTSRVV